MNWAGILQLLRLASTAACVLLSADDGSMPAWRSSDIVKALATRAHAARYLCLTRRGVFTAQLEDRSATFRDALIHLTNCANGRGKLQVRP
jgi:hypothetical protein